LIDIYPGRCLLLTRPRPGETEHCFVVVTEPYGDPAQVVIVNFTTRKPTSDPTVILVPEDHPSYLTKAESAVNYGDALLPEVGNLQVLLAINKKLLLDDCPPATLKRIQDGLLESERTPNLIKDHFRATQE
jgi:hypothetical protein